MLPLALFQSVFNSSTIGSYLLSPSPDPVFLAVNDAFLHASSRKREDLVGKRLFAAFDANPDDPSDTGVAALRESLARVIATGNSDSLLAQRYPIKIRTPQGKEVYEERFWNAVNTPIFDDDGQLVCVLHQTIDVTGQVRAEEQMRESAERLELATGAAKLGIWVWNIQADQANWENDRLYEIFGLPTSSAALSVAQFLREFIHPDDAEPFQRAFSATIETGRRLHFECRFYRASDRALRWVELTGLLERGPSGTPERIIGTIADITERKSVEVERQRFVSLAERSTDFIGMADLNLRPFFLNRSGLAMVGLDSLEDALRTPFAEFFFPEDRAFIVNEFLARVMEKGHGEVEVRFRHFKTGAALWMIYSVSTLHDEHGRQVGYATVSRNITERKEAEEALRQADRRKDEFLAMLAHELRNPLAPISAAAQVLKMAGSDERRIRQSSEIIERQVNHMTELVNDLLDVSRVTRGLVVLEQEDLDLKTVAGSAIEQARPLFEARRHALVTRMGAQATPVRGDRTRLIQVIVNLLTNAAKYTPEGGEIVISVEVQGTEARLCVADNGIGIEPALLPHVFDLFTQAERTPDRSQGGLGLGLALVKSVMALHGGHVEAHSDGRGKGSRFMLYLPLLSKAETEQKAMREVTRPARVAKPVRLMVVDDNVDAANALAALLTAAGNRVVVAADPRSALQTAAEDPPQAFILDIGLPEMDGYELARRLRASRRTADAVFIALTGYGQERDRILAKAAGFDHHFVKPIDMEKLAGILAELG